MTTNGMLSVYLTSVCFLNVNGDSSYLRLHQGKFHDTFVIPPGDTVS
jgi:hypothetical protein